MSEFNPLDWIDMDLQDSMDDILSLSEPSREYVCSFDGVTEQRIETYMRKEEIVRCRDCKRMRDWTADELADSYDKEELADGWCEFFRIGTYDDFFCAWGERGKE